MKKLLIISAFYRPYISWAEVAIENRLSDFEKWYNITIITSLLDKKLLKKQKLNTVKIIRLWFWNSFDKFLFPFLSMFFILRNKFDIYMAVLETFAGLGLALSCFFSRNVYKKSILNIQSWTVDDLSWFSRLILKFIHIKIKYIVAISNSLSDRAKRFWAKKIGIIPNGVDLSKFSYDKKIEKKDFISIWRLHKIKWFDKLFIVWKKLLDKGYNYKLTIIWDWVIKNDLKKQVNNLWLKNNIIFLGFLEYNEIVNKLQKSKYFILNSQKEGLWNVFIEALACGCIPIWPHVWGIPDIITNWENWFLYESWNLEKLVNILVDIENNNINVRYLKRSIEKFSWNKITQDYLNLFDKVINENV